MPQLARRIGRAKPSAIMVVAEKAKQLKAEGRDIISFSIGVPNFLPGEHVYAAARDALAKDSGQYGSNRGADALLDAFLEHMAKIGLTGYDRANIATGIGAKHVHLQPGRGAARRRRHDRLPDAVLDQLLRHRRHRQREDRPAAVPGLAGLQAHARRSSTPRWRRSRRCSCSTIRPTRPAWSIRRKRSSRWPTSLVKYPDTWIITDDIYNRMVFDGLGYHNFVHARPELRERVIFIDSLSKTYGMPGWRVGFMAGPEAVAQAVTTLNSNHITNIPEVVTRRRDRRADRPAGRARRPRTPSSRPSATR